MTIHEAIGQFYLGHLLDNKDELVNYDAADLTTHAVIVGMTGSGKTGLGLALLEEASIDHIPVIAVDPKGDLGNLALAFPNLAPDDFKPWADVATLNREGKTLDSWAEEVAQAWKNGLEASGQSPQRVKNLKESNRVTIYTPGSDDGVPLSLLADLTPPDDRVRQDPTSYAETLDATAAALRALIGNTGDPLDPEHLYLVQILRHFWDQNIPLTLPDLIKTLLDPPFKTLGIMPLDDVIPPNNRRRLAMSLNGLLASPSLAAWTKGRPLDCQQLFYDDQLRPQTAVINVAQLSETERIFFVTLLLSNLISWMRSQPGTSSLRAILYMDEIFGYLPPTANPPTKALFLTLLKQARAYGLGLILSTQNPVDLDYKALSNAGTWFIGRLQTAQDRNRLRDGLLAASTNGLSASELDEAFDKLGKRTFLLHNVHDSNPVLFHTRWAMSYLAGPMDRQRLQLLKTLETNTDITSQTPSSHSTQYSPTSPTTSNMSSLDAPYTPVAPMSYATDINSQSSMASMSCGGSIPPVVATSIRTYYAPTTSTDNIYYEPFLLLRAEVYFSDKVSDTRHSQNLLLEIPFDTHGEPDWDSAQPSSFSITQLAKAPVRPSEFLDAPDTICDKKEWISWEKGFSKYLRHEKPLEIYQCKSLKMYAEPGETEDAFRQRLAPILREARDAEVGVLRKKYADKEDRLEKQLLTAEDRLRREQAQSSDSWLEAGASFGSAILGAFMGRKVASRSNIRAASTAVRRASRVQKERQDVEMAQQRVDAIHDQIIELEEELNQDLDALRAKYDVSNLEITTRTITPLARDIEVKELALLWSIA